MADQSTAEKVYENRLRRAAERQELRIEKSRRRDPRAPDYNKWKVVDLDGNLVAGVRGVKAAWTLEQVEAFLEREPPQPPPGHPG